MRTRDLSLTNLIPSKTEREELILAAQDENNKKLLRAACELAFPRNPALIELSLRENLGYSGMQKEYFGDECFNVLYSNPADFYSDRAKCGYTLNVMLWLLTNRKVWEGGESDGENAGTP